MKKMRRMRQRQPFKKAAQYRSESMLVWDHDACRTRNFCNECEIEYRQRPITIAEHIGGKKGHEEAEIQRHDP